MPRKLVFTYFRRLFNLFTFSAHPCVLDPLFFLFFYFFFSTLAVFHPTIDCGGTAAARAKRPGKFCSIALHTPVPPLISADSRNTSFMRNVRLLLNHLALLFIIYFICSENLVNINFYIFDKKSWLLFKTVKSN